MMHGVSFVGSQCACAAHAQSGFLLAFSKRYILDPRAHVSPRQRSQTCTEEKSSGVGNEKDIAYSCGRGETTRKRSVWTRFFFLKTKKKCIFKTKTHTCVTHFNENVLDLSTGSKCMAQNVLFISASEQITE